MLSLGFIEKDKILLLQFGAKNESKYSGPLGFNLDKVAIMNLTNNSLKELPILANTNYTFTSALPVNKFQPKIENLNFYSEETGE